MADSAGTATSSATSARRPVWLTCLAVYSVLLGLITFIPQLYYVLFAIDRQLFPIGPHSNPLGDVWYNYILGGHQGGYLEVDAGTLAGGIEDAFMMGPLYLVTGYGLLRRRPWVVPVGLVTGAMIWYAILYFILSGTLGAHADATDVVTTLVSSVPYVIYPLWLVPVLLARRSLFVARPTSQDIETSVA